MIAKIDSIFSFNWVADSMIRLPTYKFERSSKHLCKLKPVCKTLRYGFGIANFEERGILKWISSTFQPIL